MEFHTAAIESVNELNLQALRESGRVTLASGTELIFEDHRLQTFQGAAARFRDEISHRKNNFRGEDTYPPGAKDGAEDALNAIATLEKAKADLLALVRHLRGPEDIDSKA